MLMFIPVWTIQSQGAISANVHTSLDNAVLGSYQCKCSYQFGQYSHRELSVLMFIPVCTMQSQGAISANVHTSLDNAVLGSYQC